VLAATAGELGVEERAELQERAAGVGGHPVVLVTCHRVELYGFGEPPDLEMPVRLEGEDAIRRLFRVTAGLESAVMGEDEILHQVREAQAAARSQQADGRALDPRLARLFEEAIAVGRRARAGSSAPKTDLAQRAVAWLAQRADLAARPVLVAGTGVMGGALARAARAAGAEVVIAGRDGRRADRTLAEAAAGVDGMAAIAVALGGPWTALEGAVTDLPPLADLSSPPAVPASVRQALGDRMLDVDALFERLPAEAGWAERAEALAAEGVEGYLTWLRSRQAVDAVRTLRERAEERRRARVERFLRGAGALDGRGREQVERLTRQLVSDLLHEPLVALRTDPDGSGEAARRLFGL
jgi:glutamyl-tRNA reductase